MGNIAALQDWALVTPQQVKAHCGIDDNQDVDDLIITLINAATRMCENYCKRAFVRRDITENRIGDGGNILLLNRRPVYSLSSVTLTPSGGSASTLTEDSDFTLHKDAGYMTRPISKSFWASDLLSLCWTLNAKIVITYNAGYAATRVQTQYEFPEAALAVLITVSNWYENRLGIKSQSISGVGSIDYGEIGELPMQAKKLLGMTDVTLGIA